MYAIDKILFVSDSNINYLGFWNSISKFYNTVFNIKPHLFFIGHINNQNEKFLSNEYGEVSVIEPIKDIPIIIQALWGKFWLTTTEPETNWLIGDIDLYLLDKNYLYNCLSKIDNDNAYIHLNANGYKLGNWWDNPKVGIPGYWHLAKGKIFQEYLKLSNSFEEDCRYIFESKKYGILYNGLINNELHAPNRVKDKKEYGYICCEEQLSTERLIPYKNSIHGFTYPEDSLRLETIFAKNGQSTPCEYSIISEFNKHIKYIDFHSPRPYDCFAKDIETLIYNAIN
jgi:hypothetical protein